MLCNVQSLFQNHDTDSTDLLIIFPVYRLFMHVYGGIEFFIFSLLEGN